MSKRVYAHANNGAKMCVHSVFSCRDFILDPSPDRGASGIPRLLSAPSATVVVSRSGPGALVDPVRPVSITGVYGLPVEARAPQRDKKIKKCITNRVLRVDEKHTLIVHSPCTKITIPRVEKTM